MVFSIKINYKGLDNTERSKLRYKLYGRVTYLGKDCYYYPGLLDRVRFYRIGNGHIVTERPVKIPGEINDRVKGEIIGRNFKFDKCMTGRERLLSKSLVNGYRICNVPKEDLLYDELI